MRRGTDPNSLANLQPRAKDYGAEKKERRVTVTHEGWEGATAALKEAGFHSVSRYLEELGRGRAITSPVSGGLDIIKAAGFASLDEFLEALVDGRVKLLHPRRPDKLE